MTEHSLRLTLDLRFPGGSDLPGDLELSGSAPADAFDQALIISSLPELARDHEERIVESILLAVTTWSGRVGAVIEGDPSPEIRRVVAALLPPDSSKPTAVQIEKFGQFGQWEHRDAAIMTVRRAIAIGGLETPELSEGWGITVFPDSHTGIRLNVGNRFSTAVRRDGALRIYLVGEKKGVSRLDGVSMAEGFRSVDASYSLIASEGEATDSVLDDPEVQRQNRRFVELHARRLPKPNWHNPLTESLLDRPAREDSVD